MPPVPPRARREENRVSSAQTRIIFFVTRGRWILRRRRERFTFRQLCQERQSGRACFECLRKNLRLPKISAVLENVYVHFAAVMTQYQREALHKASTKHVFHFGL